MESKKKRKSVKKCSLMKYGDIQRRKRTRRRRRGGRGQGGDGGDSSEKDVMSMLRSSLESTIRQQKRDVQLAQRREDKKRRRESMDESKNKKNKNNEDDEDDETIVADDPYPSTAFSKFPTGLEKKHLEQLSSEDYIPKMVRIKGSGGGLGDETLKCRCTISSNALTPSPTRLLNGSYGIREKLLKQWGKNTKLSELQRLMLPAMMNFKDVVFLNRSDEKDARDVRRLYALHCLNHIMRSRMKVRKHDAELKENRNKKERKDSHRDQGFCRPRILVLLPFRSDCEIFVNDLLSLLPERYKIHNKRRFQDEFGDPPSSSDDDDDNNEGTKEIPEWRRVFPGNNDDCFRIGLQISTSSLRLFTDFYHSDIIVCSPLGLRLVTATADEREETNKGDVDFLSSIEILIADRAGILEMQNWENVTLALENSNLVPKKNIEIDLNRIYDWALNEQGSYYRQNLIFSSFRTVEMRSATRRYCRNANGAVWLSRTCDGVLSHLLESTRQVFQRIPLTDQEEVSNHSSLVSSASSSTSSPFVSALERRARYFKRKYESILRGSKTHVLLYVESYFDFLRVQHFLRSRLPEEDLCCISSGTSVFYSSSDFSVSSVFVSRREKTTHTHTHIQQNTQHRYGPCRDRKST